MDTKKLRQYADIADAGNKHHWAVCMREAADEIAKLQHALAFMMDMWDDANNEMYFGSTHFSENTIKKMNEAPANAKKVLKLTRNEERDSS